MGRLGQTLSDVAARARRRPVRSAALSAGAAGVAAVIAIPLAIGGTGAPSAARDVPYETVHASNEYPHTVPWAWSGLTMNGRPPDDAGGKAALPWFDVVRGEKLTFTVTVTVPAHAEMTKFFLGITVSGDETGVGPHDPIGMTPVLATASHLTAGRHRFTVHWTVPGTARPSPATRWPARRTGRGGRRASPADAEGPMANVFVEPAGN